MTVGTPRYVDGTKVYPEYIRGHCPACRKGQFGNIPAWNKGLVKGDHPSIEKMGFQPGHEPYNDWSKVNELLKTDPEVKRRWIQAKTGKTAWNKGLTKDKYPNGIVCGPEHGNWKSNARGIRDLSVYRELRVAVFKRDDYTCQNCHKRGGKLNMHHIIPFRDDESLGLSQDNCITLCRSCHLDLHFPNRHIKRQ